MKEEKASSPAKKAKPAKTAGAAAATGGADVKEIVFSFDTTGSMYPCLTQVQNTTRSSQGHKITTDKIMKDPFTNPQHWLLTWLVCYNFAVHDLVYTVSRLKI